MHPLTIRRRELHMTVDTLIRLSGVGATTIYDIESGTRRSIRFDTAERLASAVQSQVHTLFSGNSLTDVGRPPGGKWEGTDKDTADGSERSGLSDEMCLNCFVLQPRAGRTHCISCEEPMPARP
ncbi:helix-turn-helix transcriptional regulator [Candidatus Saccharibacteria bacterium]|nr:helix-turn-helix transcriptional regulator [Candidatus Saccharibacteria bacterium]